MSARTIAALATTATAALALPATAGAQPPQLQLQPDEVNPGGTVAVSGTCGPSAAGQDIQITIGGGIEGGQLARTGTAPGTGDFVVEALIPPTSPTGSGTVIAGCGLGADQDPRAQLTISPAEQEGAPPVSRGDVGELVAFWQDRLNEWLTLTRSPMGRIAVDAIFGPQTEAATLAFQRAEDQVEPDGVVDPVDRVALRDAIEALEQGQGEAAVGRGDTGELVMAWQDRVNRWLGVIGSDLHPIAVDGIFGPQTEEATLAFQRASDQVKPDGVVDAADRLAVRDALAALLDDRQGAAPVSRGSIGELVTFWQDRVSRWLELTGSDLHPIAVDAIFGPETEAATLEFQRSNEQVQADAVVDPLDRVALRDAIESLEQAPDDGVAPVGSFSVGTRQSADFPSIGAQALLGEIRTGSHEGFERLVFEFSEPGDLDYRVRYVAQPPVAPSGQPVPVEGDVILDIHMTGATGFQQGGGDPGPTYTGPDRFAPEGLEVVNELARVEDFEGHLHWVAGTDVEAPFSVTVLEDPMRLVVDIGR